MTKPDRAEIYKTADGQWYWRIRAGNNEIISSGEGYEHRADLVHMLEKHFPHVEIFDRGEQS